MRAFSPVVYTQPSATCVKSTSRWSKRKPMPAAIRDARPGHARVIRSSLTAFGSPRTRFDVAVPASRTIAACPSA